MNDGTLTLWSKVGHGATESYVTNGATVTIAPKTGNTHTLSANLLCENGYTYTLQAFDFNYGEAVGTGVESQESKVESQKSKVLRNGQLLIIRDGKTYNAQGAQLQ